METIEMIKPEKVRELLRNTDGKIFRVKFIKRTTLEERTMVCRIGVSKGVNGTGMAYDPKSRGLITVYDMQKGDWRMINLDAVIDMRVDGTEYKTV